MFGFLKLKKHGLTPRDERLYRASHCGTCVCLRDATGLASTLLTNYDATFLHLVWAALEASLGTSPPVADRPCAVLPVRRVPFQALSEDTSRALAAVTISLVAAKLRDDVEDEGGLGHRLALRLLRGKATSARRILEEQGFPVGAFEELGTRQQALEQAARAGGGSPTLHELAAPTADLLAAIFAHPARREGRADPVAALEALGSSLGRFLYAWDAVTDREHDRKRGRFNALEASFGNAESGLVPARAFLVAELSAFERALHSLPLGEREPVARALVHSMRCRLEKALPRPASRPEALLPVILKARHAHERGDCDCDCSGCDCSGCDCSACDCSGCSCDACSSADCACDCCDCLDCCGHRHHRCCCSDVICCWSSSGSSRPAPPPPPPNVPPGYPVSGPQAPQSPEAPPQGWGPPPPSRDRRRGGPPGSPSADAPPPGWGPPPAPPRGS